MTRQRSRRRACTWGLLLLTLTGVLRAAASISVIPTRQSITLGETAAFNVTVSGVSSVKLEVVSDGGGTTVVQPLSGSPFLFLVLITPTRTGRHTVTFTAVDPDDTTVILALTEALLTVSTPETSTSTTTTTSTTTSTATSSSTSTTLPPSSDLATTGDIGGLFEDPPPTAGDPVTTTLGEYTLETQDLDLGGPLRLGFSRYFGSFLGAAAQARGFYTAADVPLGANWVHNFLILLQKNDARNMAVYYIRGKTISFRRENGSWRLSQPAGPTYRGTAYQLAENGTRMQMLDPDTQLIYTFDVTGMPDNSVRALESLSDRNGNTLSLSYNADGSLRRVADGLGRSLDFGYTVSASRPRMTSVTDAAGRSVRFSYAAALQESSTDARGNVTRYTYADNRIESLTQPEGNTPVRNTFRDGLVAAQADGLGNTTRLAYDAGKSASVTDPLGQATVHRFDSEKRFVEYVDPAGKTIRYGYDGSHRRTSIVDRLGDRSTATYDPVSGKVTSLTDNEGKTWRYRYASQPAGGLTFYDLERIDFPDGTSEQFTYDARGNLLARQDKSGRFWVVTYNARGQPLTVTNPEGGVTRYQYNSDGTLTSRTDAGGQTTSFAYDGFKRLERIERPDATRVTFTYDANNNLVSRTDEQGKTVRYTYDANNRLRDAAGPADRTWKFGYDANDRLTTVTDPAGNSRRFSYDALRRLSAVVDANGNAISYGYDARGWLTSIIDPAAKIWSLTYDDEGVITSLRDPVGGVRRFVSDKQGRIKSLTDATSQSTALGYDAMGRLESWTNPLGETISFGYDERGLLVGASAPGDISASYRRNGLGQVVRITDPNGKVRSLERDTQGRVTTATDPLGNTTRFTYDARNRPSRITLPLGTLTPAYDEVGRSTRLLYSDGTDLQYSYDDAGRVVSATGAMLRYDVNDRIISSNGIDANRDAGGRIVGITLAPGKAVTYAYDSRSLLTSVTDWLGGITRFAYDDVGRVTSVTRPNGVISAYSYDAGGRVMRVMENRGDRALSSIALTRDGAGRIREASRNVPLEEALTLGARKVAVNDADQVAGDTYDAMGRLATGQERRYSWDLASRLTAYSEGRNTVAFSYDAFGNRLTRTQAGQTRRYVWNYALGRPSISIIQDGAIPTRYSVHTPGGLLLYSMDATSQARLFHHYDELGSTIFLTDDRGQVTDSYAYSPYGALTATTGSSDNPFTYLGAWGVLREPATPLYWMQASFYDGSLGRFLSRDPQGMNLRDPKSGNPYRRGAAIEASPRIGLSLQAPLPRSELQSNKDRAGRFPHPPDLDMRAIHLFAEAGAAFPGFSAFSSSPLVPSPWDRDQGGRWLLRRDPGEIDLSWEPLGLIPGADLQAHIPPPTLPFPPGLVQGPEDPPGSQGLLIDFSLGSLAPLPAAMASPGTDWATEQIARSVPLEFKPWIGRFASGSRREVSPLSYRRGKGD